VVEDDVEVQRSVRQVLEEEGYTTSSAVNGKEALRRLAKGERPSLILLDLIMPVMDGWDLLAILHEDEELSTIPVVVLSAVADRAQDLGAPVLRKPVNLAELVSTVALARAA
jgi:CheY-like chemotaxis protein